MKAFKRRFMLTTCLLTLLLPTTSPAIQEQRLALVIGNVDYDFAPLTNPVNDAQDMAHALAKCDFTVITALNVTRSEMRHVIRDFGDKIKRGGIGLFYYAGHGIQVKGQNYLVPIDAKVEREDEVPDECLMVSSVLRKMETAANRINIMILDACRNNPFARSFRSTHRGLARVEAPKGSIVSYATAPGSVAAEGTGRNGLYTAKLLKHMMTPGVPVEMFFKEVRVDVVNASGGSQIPWTESSLISEFQFIIEENITVMRVPQTKTTGEIEKEKVRLEKERQELERLELEIKRKELEAKRKRLETKNQKLETAELLHESEPEPEVVKEKEDEVIKRDGRFIAYKNGIVYDTETELEWVAGPDKDMNWYEAKDWVDNLNIAGGGWRMPTLDELQGLFKKRAGSRNMTPLLKTTGWGVWSGEIRGSSGAWRFGFHGVGLREWRRRTRSNEKRAFAVRSRSDG